MIRPTVGHLTRLVPTRQYAARTLYASPAHFATKPAREPKSSQGHTTEKTRDPIAKGKDVQSASAARGQEEQSSATGSGEDQPFDAARQGSSGGEAKGDRHRGPFKDQVGGQDEADKGAGVKLGGQEEAAAPSLGEGIKQSLGFGGLKKMRSEGKNFHTSARSLADTPRADPDGARDPKDKVEGAQNAHLSHTEGGSQGSAKTGNAAAEPHLPSHSKSAKNSADQSSSSKRSFSTSARALADPNTPSTDAPRPAEKDAQSQTGLKQQPRGDNTEHGGHQGGPTQGGTAAPDPGLSKDQKEGAKKSGMGVRSFSTSARRFADPNTPSSDAPRPAEKDAQSQTGLKQQPRGDNTEHGGHQGGPTRGETAAPDPGLSKGEKGGDVKSGMGVRSFSTSSRVRATKPPGGYAKAQTPEPADSGYNVPPEALPLNLKSAYKEQDPNAVKSAPAGLETSLNNHSSTASDPPNRALRQAALDGTLADRNPQPHSEVGRQGLDEAWKNRK